jgi:hypothetical protein
VNECEKGSDKTEPKDGRYITGTSGGKDLRDAGETLCHFIDEDEVLNSKNGPQRPLVILAFDEADTLTDNAPVEEGWNLLSELCHVLQQINHLHSPNIFVVPFDKRPVVVQQLSPRYPSSPESNFRSQLRRHRVPGIEGYRHNRQS